jgi:hypothetical protein
MGRNATYRCYMIMIRSRLLQQNLPIATERSAANPCLFSLKAAANSGLRTKKGAPEGPAFWGSVSKPD